MNPLRRQVDFSTIRVFDTTLAESSHVDALQRLGRTMGKALVLLDKKVHEAGTAIDRELHLASRPPKPQL
jgi:hypothetical protein